MQEDGRASLRADGGSSFSFKKIKSREGLPAGGERRAATRARAKRRRYSAEQKAALILSYHASGEPLRDFCAHHGMAPSTLTKWLRMAQGEASSPQLSRSSRRLFTPEERRAAVEAYLASGHTQKDFGRLWGVSATTLSKWVKRYEREGPKGLEDRPGEGRGRSGKEKRLPAAVRAEIVNVKQRFPNFGLLRVRDFLARFRGIRVSAGGVRNTLRAEGIEPVRRKKKPRRKAKPPRRFERSRPGELWQSDITSFVLARHSRRVYLTVFLDDFSRYVVSFALATHQRAELVTESLLEGVARFGKPKEVLTDQGRQYFSWRGKSGFQKLLEREGIRHVVSRTHHPQTLGKCERLWKTVGEEFWSRDKPDDLADARERLEHFFAHYNHFRPHQGIDGLVPADRFFGAQDVVRRTVEERMHRNELALALEEPARRPVFLCGQIGDQQVSLHGEKGRLVIQTPEGGRQEMGFEELGIPSAEEKIDDERDDEHEGGGNVPFGAGIDQTASQTSELQAPAAAGHRGAGTVGARLEGGAREGSQTVHGDPGVLAGPRDEGRDRTAAGGLSAAGLAALPTSALGHAGRPFEAAAQTRQDVGHAVTRFGESGRAEEAHPRAGGEARARGGPDPRAQGASVESRARDRDGGAGCSQASSSQEACAPQRDEHREDATRWSCEEGSEAGWPSRRGSAEVNDSGWPDSSE